MKCLKRAIIVVVLPIAVVWTFASTLFREIGSAFKYAWWDVRGEVSAARRDWSQK